MKNGLRENPNCGRTYATFRVGGPRLKPAEFTTVIGVEPTSAFLKGQDIGTSDRPVPSSTGIWLLSTEELLTSTSIETHLWLLLDKLRPASARIKELAAEQSLEMDFFCYWRSKFGHGGPELSPDVLSRIASLGASLGFDIYLGDSSNT